MWVLLITIWSPHGAHLWQTVPQLINLEKVVHTSPRALIKVYITLHQSIPIIPITPNLIQVRRRPPPNCPVADHTDFRITLLPHRLCFIALSLFTIHTLPRATNRGPKEGPAPVSAFQTLKSNKISNYIQLYSNKTKFISNYHHSIIYHLTS